MVGLLAKKSQLLDTNRDSPIDFANQEHESGLNWNGNDGAIQIDKLL